MSLKEGRKGQPGEIKGIFYEADKPLGELSKNTEYGIFGKAYTDLSSEEYATPVHTADPDEVKKGDAWILTTLEKDHVEKFKIKIEKINKNDPDSVKNMVIRVTDKDLIEKSGGYHSGNERKSDPSERENHRSSHSCLCQRSAKRLRDIHQQHAEDVGVNRGCKRMLENEASSMYNNVWLLQAEKK